ncbi:MAG: polysaccharide pyruvyl transferase family protein [Eudoraea sp.]|nr:polysaccharide pyruvyl transferase family protein [Eudoraea sp.]
MKIALITIHKVTNYGAILQAFATTEVLSRFGHVQFIDYQNKYLTSHLHLIRFKPSVKGIKMLAHDILNFPNRYRFTSKFKKFIREQFDMTAKLSSEDLMKGRAGDYDVYICGSDQIWNPKIVNSTLTIDPIYFLAFAEEGATKISYASSMGNYIFSDEERQELKFLLQDFHGISIREKEGKELLDEILPDREIRQVVDPTLLLSGSKWLATFQSTNTPPEKPYILVYSVPRTQLIRRAIAYFAEKLQLRVIAIDKMLIPMKKVDLSMRYAGPRDFIELYANASFVITDSFHGTCFSINFEKPFICIPATKNANRQEGLLAAVGLRDRIIYEEDGFGSISTDLDYTEPRKKLEMLRQDSLDYLKQTMSSLAEK